VELPRKSDLALVGPRVENGLEHVDPILRRALREDPFAVPSLVVQVWREGGVDAEREEGAGDPEA